MNFTLFKNLGYDGIGASPSTLTDFGDLAVYVYFFLEINTTKQARGYSVSFYTGNYLNFTTFGSTSMDGKTFTQKPSVTPIFARNSTAIPLDGFVFIPERVDTMDTPNGKLISSLGIIGLILCFAAFMFVAVFRNSKPVKRAVILDMSLVILGCTFCYSSLFFYLNRPSTFTCTGRIVAVAIGFGLVVSSLIIKNVYMISVFGVTYMLSKEAGVMLRTRFYVLRFLVIGIDAVLAALWAKFSDIKAVLVTTPTYTAYVCQDKTRLDGSSKWSIALYAYNGILFTFLFPTIYYLKYVRISELNESRILGPIVIIVLLFFLLIQGMASFSLTDTGADTKVCICLWIIVTSVLVSSIGSRAVEVFLDSQINLKKGGFSATQSTTSSVQDSSDDGKGKPKVSVTGRANMPGMRDPQQSRTMSIVPGDKEKSKQPFTFKPYYFMPISTKKHRLLVCKRDSVLFDKWRQVVVIVQKTKKCEVWVSLTSLDKTFGFYIGADCTPIVKDVYVTLKARIDAPRKDQVTLEFGGVDEVNDFLSSFSEGMQTMGKE
ncbi:UNVERIFIED_CONTAM: hypothetical protein HDU68_005709 [Siphonaria sp. JEL0065]|nr:hypothetical protein HDU68_005709 [Siphonaria sp. JEL0065]